MCAEEEDRSPTTPDCNTLHQEIQGTINELGESLEQQPG